MKKIIAIKILVFVFIIATAFTKTGSFYAQDWQWAKSASGAGSDQGAVSCVDATGNVYVAGTFDSPSFLLGSTFINNGTSTTDIFLAKYNSNGNLLWSAAFGNSQSETIDGICVDNTGSLFIAGTFSGTSMSVLGSTALTSLGMKDVYVAKLNATTGSCNWSRRDGGSGDETVGGLVYYPSSTELLMTGGFGSANTTTFGSLTATNFTTTGTTDVFLAKYNASTGVPSFLKRDGGAGSESGLDIAINTSGDPFIVGAVTGATTNFNAINATTYGGTDGFIVNYFNNGNYNWMRLVGGVGNDQLNAVAVDPSGSAIITGQYNSNTCNIGTFTLTNGSIVINNENAFVAKYTGTTVSWVQNIISNIKVIGSDVATDNAGNAYVCGAYRPASSDNVFLRKYNSAGAAQWATIVSSNSSGGNSLISTSTGNLYCTGYISNTAVFGPTTLTTTSAGVKEFFIGKISCVSTIINGLSSVCPGNSSTLTISGGPTSYTWSTGANTSSIIVTPTAATSYSAIGSNSACSANSYSFSVSLLTASVNAGADFSLTCGQTQIVNAVTSPSIPLNVSWSPTIGLIGPSSLSPTIAGGYAAQNYTLTTVLSNSCIATDIVNVVSQAQTPAICMVTVDSLSNNNEVFWEKSLYTKVDSFIIYRETSTNIYKRIGAVNKNAFSMYADTNRSIGPANGNPNLTSYRYKLQLRDSCGNYSALSPYHQTIFIQDQQNGNFNWNSYAIESSSPPISNYVLSRQNVLTGITVTVGATTANLLSDPQYSVLATSGNVKWFVDAQGFNCNPTFKQNSVLVQKTRTKSNNSNDKQFPPNGLSENTKLSYVIDVFPNPADGKINIKSEDLINMNYSIEIKTILGQTVLIKDIKNSSNSTQLVDMETLTSGIYFLNVICDNKIVLAKKVILNK